MDGRTEEHICYQRALHTTAADHSSAGHRSRVLSRDVRYLSCLHCLLCYLCPACIVFSVTFVLLALSSMLPLMICPACIVFSLLTCLHFCQSAIVCLLAIY